MRGRAPSSGFDLYGSGPFGTLAPVNGTSMRAGPALLVIGHPGHELMVHGWLEASKPLVAVLTDGSGHTGVSRLSSTAALIARAGGRPGSIFGRFADTEIYRALLDHHFELFTGLVEELSGLIIENQIALVVGDDAEGFNPTHDICRLIIDAAVRHARVRSGRPVLNVAFRLIDAPEQTKRASNGGLTVFELSNAALERKMAAAFGYPEMAGEVAAARKRLGDDAFRIESFRHVRDGEIWAPAEEPPYYERYGQKRVDEGAYPEVIYYEQHIRPLADLLHARSLREAS